MNLNPLAKKLPEVECVLNEISTAINIPLSTWTPYRETNEEGYKVSLIYNTVGIDIQVAIGNEIIITIFREKQISNQLIGIKTILEVPLSDPQVFDKIKTAYEKCLKNGP